MDLLPFLNGTPIVFSPFGVLNLAVLIMMFAKLAQFNSALTEKSEKMKEHVAEIFSDIKTRQGIFDTRLTSIESAIFDLREGQRTIIQTMVANHNANIMTLYRSGMGVRFVGNPRDESQNSLFE
jgi:hypothetical protein